MNTRLIAAFMLVPSLALTAAACRSSAKGIEAKDYNQSCSKDEDCKTVVIGDPCKCSCNTAAIHEAEEDEYKRDMDKLRADCAKEAAACTPCAAELPPPICHAGTCEVKNQISTPKK